MEKEEWTQVLLAIANDPILPTLTIYKLEDDYDNGFRAMALTGDAIDENVIIYKGTSSAYEWMDNAVGGYSEASPNQKSALAFVDGINIVDNKSFVVRGHFLTS